MTNVHVVYAHPSAHSFTREVRDAFLGGLADTGHTWTVSDLYAMAFRPELTLDEYEREGGRDATAPVGDDVAAEHAKLDAAEVWAFVYPVWWADCPALLKGWFDRVWTVGYAYKPARLRPARKALMLCTAGYTVAELESSGCYQAMRTTMLTDRIGERARSSEFVVLGGTTVRDSDDQESWAALRATHLRRAADLAR
ncbi:flavodoxin family protein [Asanoa ishikariensis]|uniref:NAD(P)H-dependent oxidoreductase n=1 Tax=Asanoa ishikariensis TaxID=137265 RepID=UPI000B86E8A9|nr:NAD(P)H-dependent oxidoreductase [Asanoa ishikariensis]GIF63760.1 flavodoxin family protein [Asanoa ishikariensis]